MAPPAPPLDPPLAFTEIVEFHILLIKLSLASNEIDSFAGAINQARGTCWARACALSRASH